MERTPREVLGLLDVRPDGDGDLSVVFLGDSPELARLEVDHHDPEQVFEVVVRRVPREWLRVPPGTVVGRVDEVPVHLVAVAVGLRVEVTLDAPLGAPDGSAWPGRQVTQQLRVTVTDDKATAYRLSSGEAGGEEHPWRVRQCFVPTPPDGARVLRTSVTDMVDGSGVGVDVPLGRGPSSD